MTGLKPDSSTVGIAGQNPKRLSLTCLPLVGIIEQWWVHSLAEQTSASSHLGQAEGEGVEPPMGQRSKRCLRTGTHPSMIFIKSFPFTNGVITHAIFSSHSTEPQFFNFRIQKLKRGSSNTTLIGAGNPRLCYGSIEPKISQLQGYESNVRWLRFRAEVACQHTPCKEPDILPLDDSPTKTHR